MGLNKTIVLIATIALSALVAAGSDVHADRTTLQATTANSYDEDTTFLPDFDGNGTVDFSDFTQFASKFGRSEGDDGYEARFDLNGDGEIGFSDFVVFSQHYGKDLSFGMLLPWDLSRIVPIDSVRSTPVGTRVFMRTEFANGELADLEMKFIQVVDDFLPPMPVYMVEASDSVLVALGGIARGMSGSPIFSAQGAWGAIAYGFVAQDSPPYYFFATPMEWVIGERGTVPLAKRAATWGGSSIVPLDVPLLSTGLNRIQLAPEGRSSPFSDAVAAGLTTQRQTSFAPGRPLAVGLLLGELTLGAIGTISFVDGNRVYGFGHSMDDAGPVSLPIIEAVVLGEISNLQAPYKFATFNPTVRGTLTEDRIPAVRGILGEGPELVPIRSVYSFPSGGEVELLHTMPTVGVSLDMSIDLVAGAFFRPLLGRIENDPDHSMRVTSNVSFDVTDSTLTRTRLYAAPEGRLLSLIRNATSDMSSALATLMGRDDYALQVTDAGVSVEVIAEPRYARVFEVSADSVISPGDALAVTTLLRVGRRIDREIELALAVPDSFPPGVYLLEAGSAAALGDAGPPPFFGRFPGDETLDDVFERVNSADENVVLKARLTFETPFVPPGGEGPPPGRGGGAPRQAAPPTASAQKDVDLVMEGSKSLSIKVVAPAEE
ncbi:MAG: hypothetical protein OYM47_19970 [Gemmatimonadota bacterium]|nr:hypothetical protein [Gemmatimonadota bacterium]